MKIKVYDLNKIVNPNDQSNFHEFKAVIVNGDKIILTDNEGVHTVHSLNDNVINFGSIRISAKQIIESEPAYEIDNLGTWIRTFGNRIENNYRLLLKSIKKIGLNPNNFPR